MKKLIVLRGAPGAGKSTWVRQNHLENYTLCPDTLRLMYSAPILVDGEPRITREFRIEEKVWRTIMDMLYSRMSRGDLTVIDAMARRFKDIKQYAQLCALYGYELIIVDFSSVPLETCLKQNASREPLRYVPEEAIRKVWNGMRCQNLEEIDFGVYQPVSYSCFDYKDTDWIKQLEIV